MVMGDVMIGDVPTALFLGALFLGYLSGSIPFGLILSRFAGLGDIRKIGSGNIGATNVLRTGNKAVAASVLLCDFLKGMVPVLATLEFGTLAAMAAGLGAFLGHLFPVWLKFKGGKGIATYIGVLVGLYPSGLFIFAGVWLSVALVFRYSSLAAICATFVVPIAIYYLTSNGQIALFFAALSAIAILKHHENIARLVAGTESKIGQKNNG